MSGHQRARPVTHGEEPTEPNAGRATAQPGGRTHLDRLRKAVPQADVEVTSGTIETPAFSSHVEYYDLHLPSDVEGLEWLQLHDWDSNQIYLRFSTNRAGLENLLKLQQLTWSALKPSQPSSSPALPRESDWDEEMPSRFLQWQPSTCSTSRMVDHVHDTNSTGIVLFVDPSIDRPEASKSTRSLHPRHSVLTSGVAAFRRSRPSHSPGTHPLQRATEPRCGGARAHRTRSSTGLSLVPSASRCTG
jgi:hypothetical protein